jgi:phospholipid transport system substrate-binding protein
MNIMKYFSLIGALIVGFHLSAASNPQSPVTLLKTISTQAITQLKAEKSKKGEKIPVSVVRKIINKTLLPHVDLNYMSRAVLGRAVWTKATASQKKQFQLQFTNLIINTYSSALTTFDKNDIIFHKIRGGFAGKTIVQVNSSVTAPGTQPLPVVYHVELIKNKWLLHDLSVDGVSLLQSYRAQFVSLIQNDGLNGLISTLKSHNVELAKGETS